MYFINDYNYKVLGLFSINMDANDYKLPPCLFDRH